MIHYPTSVLWLFVLLLISLTGIFTWILEWAKDAGENTEFDDTDYPNEEDE